MVVTDKKIEKQENSRVKLTVTLPADATKEHYNNLLEKYGKTLVLPGFRKGKVPKQILENKFGKHLNDEVAEELIKTSLDEVWSEIEEKTSSI